MDDPGLILFHVGTEEVFDSIHIPGARLLDPYAFTSGRDSLRNQVPELSVLDSLLTALGVHEDSKLLLYYEDENLAGRTSRVFVTLEFVGLGDRCMLLNGGLTAWTNMGGETTNLATAFSPGNVSLSINNEVIASAGEVDQFRTHPSYVIGDVRSFEEYFGELDSTDFTPSGGHVEGAIHLPYEDLFSETDPHLLKEDEALLSTFAEKGVKGTETLVFYCGSGIRASVSYLVARHLGLKPLLFDGSIEEWERLDLPVISPVYERRESD
jgi:thiosulfate/3-mercaptopyruvate sulfurtransferase